MSLWIDEYERMLRDCEKRESRLTAWEREFIDSLQHRLAHGGSLTPKQCETLDKIWERVTS